jgi:FO synthase subunit 2
MNESISTSAGAQFGQLVTPVELRRLIYDAGRIPAQRKTNYDIIATYDGKEDGLTPLDNVINADSRFGSYSRLASSKEFRFAKKSSS